MNLFKNLKFILFFLTIFIVYSCENTNLSIFGYVIQVLIRSLLLSLILFRAIISFKLLPVLMRCLLLAVMITDIRRLIAKNSNFFLPFFHCSSYRISYIFNSIPNGILSQFYYTDSINTKSYFIFIIYFFCFIAAFLNFKQLNVEENLRCCNGIKMLNKLLFEFYRLLVYFYRNLRLQIIKISSIQFINN